MFLHVSTSLARSSLTTRSPAISIPRPGSSLRLFPFQTHLSPATLLSPPHPRPQKSSHVKGHTYNSSFAGAVSSVLPGVSKRRNTFKRVVISSTFAGPTAPLASSPVRRANSFAT